MKMSSSRTGMACSPLTWSSVEVVRRNLGNRSPSTSIILEGCGGEWSLTTAGSLGWERSDLSMTGVLIVAVRPERKQKQNKLLATAVCGVQMQLESCNMSEMMFITDLFHLAIVSQTDRKGVCRRVVTDGDGLAICYRSFMRHVTGYYHTHTRITLHFIYNDYGTLQYIFRHYNVCNIYNL